MGLLSDYLPDWLPEDPQKQDAARMGLLNFGAQMLANSRQGLAPALGQGIVGGAKSYGDQLEQQQKMALQNLQTKNLGLDNRTKEMALGKQERIDQAYKQFYGKTAPVGQSSFPSAIPSAAPAVGASPDGFRQPMPNWMPSSQPPQTVPQQAASQPNRPTNQANDNYTKHLEFARYLESQGAGEEAQKYFDLAEKFKPKLKEQKILRDPQGNIVTVNVYKDGRTEVVQGFTPAEKLNFQNTGGATVGLNPFTGKPESSAKNTQSPDSIASNSLARDRLTFDRTKDKAPTEFQGKSAAYGARAEQADKIIKGLEGMYDPMAINSKVSVEDVPLVGGILGAATNKFALNANDQRAEQAQRDFINAVLRQESGASISSSEFDNARKQYFRQPGDTKEVVAQKERNRSLAIQGFKSSANHAAFSAPAERSGGVVDFGSLK